MIYKKNKDSLDDRLFKYIKPSDNIMFSELNNDDLKELLYYIESYYLSLRFKLGFEKNVTFGLELEVEDVNRYEIEKALLEKNLYNDWKIKDEETLDKGAEIISPTLIDTKNNWRHLKQVCEIINENASIGQDCGGHIHVGTQVLGSNKEYWLNFIKIWSVYENIICRFGFGEFLTPRPYMKIFAVPMTEAFWSYYEKFKNMPNLALEDLLDEMSQKRYQAVSFFNVDINNLNKILNKNTIEFRCPNGTLNPVIWQNNVNLFLNLLKYCKSSKYDDDIIERRKLELESRDLNKDEFEYNLDWYIQIYLYQALEFADMIFDNNLDKVYFLRQYFKSFEIGKNKLLKAKVFTKTY